MVLFERNDHGKLIHTFWDSVIFDEMFEEAKNVDEINFMIKNLMEDICNSAMNRAQELGIDTGDLEFEL